MLAALGLAAVAAPAAAADDGALPVVTASVTDPVALATEIVGQTAIEEVTAVLPVEAPLELPVAPTPDAPAAPTQTPASAAPPPQPAAPAPAPAMAPQAAPAPTPDAPPPAPATVQADPANVNVSIRIESPGDDGAVAQANLATDLAAAAQYPDATAQYQPALPQPDAPATAPQASSPTDEPVSEWTWNWNCLDAAIPAVELPAGAQSWSWNWDWDCDGTSANADSSEDVSGYHAPSVQYRPVNINVSIRINSPGNNGPVTQTNVAVAVVLPPLPPPPKVVVPPTVELPSVLAPVVVEAVFSEPGFAVAAPAGAAPALAPVLGELDELLHLPVSTRLHEATVAPERPAGSVAGGAVTATTGIGSLPSDPVAAVVQLELRVRGAADAAEAAPRAQARPARPAPRSHDGEEEGLTASPHDSLGVAPVGGPERTLPFAALVLLAFAFASTHSTLVSARSRPSSDAEADGPPERPG